MHGRMVQCYVCGGKGWVIPAPGSMEVVMGPKKPRECEPCHGTGYVEVLK